MIRHVPRVRSFLREADRAVELEKGAAADLP
jgi:hypothetical protein